jgi:hypothetical protein
MNETHQIHPALEALKVPITKLVPLPNNPRSGNVEAIAESYGRFGQLKPIVVQPTEDGMLMVMSGNHQLEAAKQLGWTHLAVTEMQGDDVDAVAFALIENRFGELGSVDKEKLHSQLIDVYDYHPELFESVGWDDFEIAAMETFIEDFDGIPSGQAGGYVPPVIMNTAGDTPISPVSVAANDDEAAKLVAPVGTDEKAAVISGVGGATSQGPNAKKAAAQYSIMFDDAAQMSRWWEFIRFLRSSSVYEGDTIAERLMSFIDAHSEV